MLDKIIELYHDTNACKRGRCCECDRIGNVDGTYTYNCRAKLLSDCNLMFDELITRLEEN